MFNYQWCTTYNSFTVFSVQHNGYIFSSTHKDEMCNFYMMYYTGASVGDTYFACNGHKVQTEDFPDGASVPLPPNPLLEGVGNGDLHTGIVPSRGRTLLTNSDGQLFSEYRRNNGGRHGYIDQFPAYLSDPYEYNYESRPDKDYYYDSVLNQRSRVRGGGRNSRPDGGNKGWGNTGHNEGYANKQPNPVRPRPQTKPPAPSSRGGDRQHPKNPANIVRGGGGSGGGGRPRANSLGNHVRKPGHPVTATTTPVRHVGTTTKSPPPNSELY